MSDKNAIVAVYDTHQDAENAVYELTAPTSFWNESSNVAEIFAVLPAVTLLAQRTTCCC